LPQLAPSLLPASPTQRVGRRGTQAGPTRPLPCACAWCVWRARCPRAPCAVAWDMHPQELSFSYSAHCLCRACMHADRGHRGCGGRGLRTHPGGGDGWAGLPAPHADAPPAQQGTVLPRGEHHLQRAPPPACPRAGTEAHVRTHAWDAGARTWACRALHARTRTHMHSHAHVPRIMHERGTPSLGPACPLTTCCT